MKYTKRIDEIEMDFSTSTEMLGRVLIVLVFVIGLIVSIL